VAFSDPQRVLPFLMALFGIGVVVSTVPAIGQCFSRLSTVEVLLSRNTTWCRPLRKISGATRHFDDGIDLRALKGRCGDGSESGQ
jgi:hypothetical protein